MKQENNTITLAMSGASGMPYALRLLECLLAADKTVYLVMSQAAQVVTALEGDMGGSNTASDIEGMVRARCENHAGRLKIFGYQQWSAPIASGSAAVDAMVVCPASAGCISAIALGASNNLLERAADVMIKEQRQLILVPRETPLSAIVLENLLKLARLGVTILPACPGFYHQPQRVEDLVDFIVARLLDHLGIQQSLLPPWGEENGRR